MTFSIPSPASCSANSRTAPVVAPASQTRVRRFPGRDGCGTRVQTMPEAFATSTAATRSRTCSCSSSSISCGSIIAATLFLPSPSGHTHGCPGASVGNRNSDRRAHSTVRDPSRSRPQRQTCMRAHVPERYRRRRAATPDPYRRAPPPPQNRRTSPHRQPPATTDTDPDFHARARGVPEGIPGLACPYRGTPPFPGAPRSQTHPTYGTKDSCPRRPRGHLMYTNV